MSRLADSLKNGGGLLYNYRTNCTNIQKNSGGIQMLNIFKRLVKEEEGQGMAEYGLILALIAVAVIGTLGAIGTKLSGHFTSISDQLGD